jgi:hypothetical protein
LESPVFQTLASRSKRRDTGELAGLLTEVLGKYDDVKKLKGFRPGPNEKGLEVPEFTNYLGVRRTDSVDNSRPKKKRPPPSTEKTPPIPPPPVHASPSPRPRSEKGEKAKLVREPLAHTANTLKEVFSQIALNELVKPLSPLQSPNYDNHPITEPDLPTPPHKRKLHKKIKNNPNQVIVQVTKNIEFF